MTTDSDLKLSQELETQQLGWASVYDALRNAIIGHRIPPGTKLPEAELCSIYSVSRALIRPALQALAHDGLVRIEPNRGAFVSQPTKQEAREVFEARALVEPRVASLAAEASKSAGVARLRQHLELEHKAIDSGNISEAIILSANFHLAIADMSGHSILRGFGQDLLSRSSLIVSLYWRRRDTTCESHAHHALVDAIARHDTKKAADLMKNHLVDLLSGLDLAHPPPQELSLSDMIQGLARRK